VLPCSPLPPQPGSNGCVESDVSAVCALVGACGVHCGRTDFEAHCFVGARFLPATLATDDPCVADELSLPTVTWSKTGDMPPGTEWDISAEVSKRITETFGVSIGETWTQIRQPGNTDACGISGP
jgi:hypothetical protein